MAGRTRGPLVVKTPPPPRLVPSFLAFTLISLVAFFRVSQPPLLIGPLTAAASDWALLPPSCSGLNTIHLSPHRCLVYSVSSPLPVVAQSPGSGSFAAVIHISGKTVTSNTQKSENFLFDKESGLCMFLAQGTASLAMETASLAAGVNIHILMWLLGSVGGEKSKKRYRFPISPAASVVSKASSRSHVSLSDCGPYHHGNNKPFPISCALRLLRLANHKRSWSRTPTNPFDFIFPTPERRGESLTSESSKISPALPHATEDERALL
ncbi:hypothetical protein STEG23_010836 [Scotinomys teguina]